MNSPYVPKDAADKPIDFKNLYISLPMVISSVSAVIGGLLWWAVANASDEIDEAKSLSSSNAVQIQQLVTQQALTQQQISQILSTTQAAQSETKQTRDTVIRIEERLKRSSEE